MAMYKFADEELMVSLPTELAIGQHPGEDVVLWDEKPNPEEVIEMHSPSVEVSFKLPILPGAPDELVEMSEPHLEVGEDDKKDEDNKDKSKASDKDYQAVAKKDFLGWYKNYLERIPKHKGETIALERAMSYLKRGLDILSKMVQQDFEGEIDIAHAEDARSETEAGIDRLQSELERRKKKAVHTAEITKEAQKTPAVGGIIVTVPILISSIARACINSTVSGGKDIEHTFHKLAKKWNLTEREKLEVVQLLNDMNYPMRWDSGIMVDDKEPYEYSSENNVNYVPNYQA